MNGNKLLLDTNILLYLLEGDETLSAVLEGRDIYISFITELELYGYPELSDQERKRIATALEDMMIIDINAGIKSKTIDIRRSSPLRLPDSIIAATAMYFDLPFISADKAFNKVKGLEMVHYER